MLDGYMYFKGGKNPVECESLDDVIVKKKGCLIQNFGFGVTNPTNVGSGTGGLGSGRAEFEKFTATKATDTGTCPLILACCTGDHIDEIVVVLRKAGATSKTSGDTFVQMTFSHCLVEGITWEGSDGDEAFSDNLTIAYAAMKFEYWQQDMKGNLTKGKGLQGEMAWDQTKNKVP